MKLLFLLMFTSTSWAALDKNNSNNVTQVCSPKIVVEKGNTCCNPCAPKVVTKYKTRYIKSKPTVVEKEVIKEVKIKNKKNRIKLLGGKGFTGTSAEVKGASAVLVEERGLVLGLSYDRLLKDSISIGGQIQTNKTYLLSIGLDF